ncbi:MAG: MFS transporter [Streptosporangiaceae bacterium]
MAEARWLSKLVVDIHPLRRFAQYRRLWVGYSISAIGSQLTATAVAYQAYLLTHSSFDVGLVSLIQLGPAIFAPMIGGAIADAFDRRKVLIVTAVCMAICSMGLAWNAQGDRPALWPVFLLPGASWFFSGISDPTSVAAQMSLVDQDSFLAATVLRQITRRVAMVLGPALGGILIATGGIRIAYWADVASFVVAIVAVASMKPIPARGGVTRFGFRSIVEGFTFLKGRKVIQGCLIADLNATVLGLPTSLFPAVALTRFGRLSVIDHAQIYGLLSAAPGFGAAIGAFLSGWTIHVRRQGLAVLLTVLLWGTALAGFGLSHVLAIALLCLAVAGWADLVSGSFRGTILQVETPDRLRGRLSAVQTAVVTSGPRLGNFEAGAVAALSSPEWSIVSGGLGCILGTLIIARLFPSLTRYELGARKEVGLRPAEDNIATTRPQPLPLSFRSYEFWCPVSGVW